MTTVQVDEKTRAALDGADPLVAVSDATGAVIGFFAPVRQEYADQYAEVAARAYAAQRAGGRPLTTPEVVAHLESLGTNQ